MNTQKTVILLFGLMLVVYLCPVASSGEVSLSQKQFARDLVTSVPGIENAWWSQDISLWVEIDIATFASNPELYAQQIADKLSVAAATKFQRFLCVRVYHGNQRVLAKSCNGPR
jgi:hypothetical protein